MENGDESVTKAVDDEERVIMGTTNSSKSNDMKGKLNQMQNSNSGSVVQQGTKTSPLNPELTSSRAMQLLRDWWVETQEHTTAVVLDPDYHVPIGL